jgi:hypothetical protein
MSVLVDFRRAVEQTIRQLLPAGSDGVRHVSSHVGEFGEREIMEYAVNAPAVILAPLGMPQVQRAGGGVLVTVNYGAFILTKSMSVDSRGDIALAIIEEILRVLPYQTWGGAQAPKDIESGNLYAGKIDDMGLSLWVIRWQQTLQLLTQLPTDIADFLRLHATYNLDPGADDPDDWDAPQTIELPGPNP